MIGLLNSLELFGQEKANIEVFKTLRSSGAEVHVGVNSIECGGQVGDLIRDLGFPTFTLPYGCQWSKKLFKSDASLVFKCIGKVCRCSQLLRQKIRSIKPTHIHLGNPLVYSYVYGALKTSSVPLVYRMGDEPPHDSKPNLRIWQSCFRRATVVVANSEFVQSSILCVAGNDKSKPRLIYNVAPGNGGESVAFETDVNRLSSRRRILFVGQISPHKGVHHLVDAVLKLLATGSDIVADIVGGSRYTQDFESELLCAVSSAGVESQVVFHGHVSDPTRFYQSADLLIVPSLFEEPAANVVLEAKEFGLPSVVYPSGGLPELVIHRENGFVCREKTVAALVEGIDWFLKHPKKRELLRQSARKDYEERFGAERFSRQWADVYSGAHVDSRGTRTVPARTCFEEHGPKWS